MKQRLADPDAYQYSFRAAGSAASRPRPRGPAASDRGPALQRSRSGVVTVLLVVLALAILCAIGAALWMFVDISSLKFASGAARQQVEMPAAPPAVPVAQPSADESPRSLASFVLRPTTPVPPAAVPGPAPTGGQAFSSKLRESGAGACGAQLDQLAANNNVSVSQFNTMSTWATAAVDKRLVSVTLGQKYPEGSAVPYGATSVIAAPNPLGDCDAVAVQVVPSSLSCAKIRENFGAASRLIGDLVGIPIVSDAEGQTMLVPTPNNTCVLVGLRVAYAK